MSNWKTSPYYTLPPEPPKTSIVEWDLAQVVRSDTENAALKFLSATPDPMYANPGAYIDGLIAAAKVLAANASSAAAKFLAAAGYTYMPAGWDPVMSAITFAEACFATLQTIAVNLGDPQTASVYDAWVNHTGQYYGGHLPGGSGDDAEHGQQSGNGTEFRASEYDSVAVENLTKAQRAADVRRAQDKLAPALVEDWADRAANHGCSAEKVAEARTTAAAMRAWPTKKYPD